MGKRDKGTKLVEQQISQPWGPTQPYLGDIRNEGQALYEGGAPEYFQGDTYTGMGGTSQEGLSWLEQLARGGNPALDQAGQTASSIGSGQTGIGQGQWGSLYGMAGAPSQSEQNLGGYASGAEGLSTVDQYRDLYNRAGGPNSAAGYLEGTARGDFLGDGNPYLSELWGAGADDITNRMKSLYSGMGRYGSEPMEGELTKNLGTLRAQLYAPAYEAERDRMLSAAGQLGSWDQASQGMALNALGGQTAAEQGNISNRFAASGQMDDAALARWNAMAGAQGAMTGIEGQNISNRLTAAGMAPGMDAARYAGAERLLGAGQMRDQDAQSRRDAEVARWNYNQTAPMNQLDWYNALIGSQAGLGGQTDVREPRTPVRDIFGAILGGVGALAGLRR